MGPFLLWLGIGLLIISRDITLDLVLYVPNLDYILMSISKLTKDLNCITKFSPNLCKFQVLNSRKTISSAKISADLYLPSVDVQGKQTQKISSAVSIQNKNGANMLRHYRSGHSNFSILEKLVSLFNQ